MIMVGTVRVIKKDVKTIKEGKKKGSRYASLLIVDATKKEGKPIGCVCMKDFLVDFIDERVTPREILEARFEVVGKEYKGKISSPDIFMIQADVVRWGKKRDENKSSSEEKEAETEDSLLEPDDPEEAYSTLGDPEAAKEMAEIFDGIPGEEL